MSGFPDQDRVQVVPGSTAGHQAGLVIDAELVPRQSSCTKVGC